MSTMRSRAPIVRGMLRVDAERLLGVGLEGAVEILQLLFEEAAEAVVDRRAASGRRRVVAELPLVQRNEVVPPCAGGVEALESLDRGRIEAEIEHLLVRRDRAVGVFQRLVADARELVEDVALVVVARRDLRAPLQHVDEVLVLAALLVDLLRGRRASASFSGAKLEGAGVALPSRAPLSFSLSARARRCA